jgi:hypothetical protein
VIHIAHAGRFGDIRFLLIAFAVAVWYKLPTHFVGMMAVAAGSTIVTTENMGVKAFTLVDVAGTGTPPPPQDVTAAVFAELDKLKAGSAA